MIRHTVMFTLKHEQGSDAENDFLDAALALTKIETVKKFERLRQVSKSAITISDSQWSSIPRRTIKPTTTIRFTQRSSTSAGSLKSSRFKKSTTFCLIGSTHLATPKSLITSCSKRS